VRWTSHPIPIAQGWLVHQGEEGPQSVSVDFGGLDLDSGGKQCCLIKALKASSLALSFASLAFSPSAREVGVGEAAGQAVEAQQPLDWQQHLRLAADAAGVRWGPVPTVARLNTAGALRQSPWTRPPTTGS